MAIPSASVSKRLGTILIVFFTGLLYLSGMYSHMIGIHYADHEKNRSLQRTATTKHSSAMSIDNMEQHQQQKGNHFDWVSENDTLSVNVDSNTNAKKARYSCGLVFFYHLNRVGGRTVQEHLKEATHEYLQLFPNRKDWSRALPEIESFLHFDANANHSQWWKTLEIHHGYPGLLYLQKNLTAWETAVKSQGCAFKKVTLLRNPIERLVSNIKWNDVSEESIPSFTDNMNNWMSRHLAFNTCNSNLICSWGKGTGISNSPLMSWELFQSLIRVLDTFDVVGVTEDLQSFMDAVLGRPVEMVSTHSQSYTDEPYPLTVDMYQGIVKNNMYDFRLYWRYAPTVLPIAQERGETMTLEKMRQYYTLNKPVLIKNAAPFLFNNYKDFNSKYIRQNVDSNMIIRASHYTGRLLNGDIITTVPKCMDSPDRCVYFKKDRFSYNSTIDNIATNDTDSLRTTLLSGLNRNTFAWSGANKGKYCIYISTHGGALPHHHAQRFNLLMEGKKRWVLVDPSAYANVSQTQEFELEEATGFERRGPQTEAFELEDLKRQGLEEVKWATYKSQDWFRDVISNGTNIPHYDFVQEAGDFFFLPDAFTHGTIDLTPHAIGVIFRGKMTKVGTEGLIFPDSYFNEDIKHLWRKANTGGDSVTAQGHQLPGIPIRSIRTAKGDTKRSWQRLAGGAAKLFSNQNLDHVYSG